MLSTKKIGFIGAGNMANAIIRGLIAAGEISCGNIFVSDKDETKLAEFAKMGINITTDNSEVEQNCDIVILAVKPQIMDSVLEEIRATSAGEHGSPLLYISIAAGVTLAKLQSKLGESAKIVRTMPNTPLMVGSGVTIVCPNDNLTADEIVVAEAVFACGGDVVRLDEKHINVGMALSASSPAYAYMFIDAMAKAGEKRGIPYDIALKLATKAVIGSGKMVTDTDVLPLQLKDNVCSPNGTTIEAVKTLETNDFAGIIDKAIDSCVKRGEELDKLG